MRYIVLNNSYSLRNERTCSYIVRKSQFFDSDLNDYQAVFPIPPFIGYILANIGKKEYRQSIVDIGNKLDIDAIVLQHFLPQIIEQPSKSVSFIGKEIVFPENLLIHSNQKDNTSHFTVENFSPMNEYIQYRPRIPLMVNFMVTEKCNTNCRYCYAKRDTRKELSTSEVINVIRQMSDSGVIRLTLTGGDLFARKDWYDIFSASKDADFGYLISTKTILKEADIIKLIKLGISQIQFSLDSVCAEILKEMIRVDSQYVDDLKTMFKMCSLHNLKISLRTVLCKQNANIERIEELCAFVDVNKCISNWVITPAFYSENRKDYNDYSVSNDMLKDVFSYLKERNMRIRPLFNKINDDGYVLQRAEDVEEFVENNQICHANTYSLSILPSGDCTVCEMLYYHKDFLLGNIKDMSIKDIWNSNKALKLFAPQKEDVDETSACFSCKVFDKCKKDLEKRVCYVDVMKVHKNLDFPDPKCPQSMKCRYIL